MCVKEYFGYNCGHCSIPYLRKCPITMANEHFPPCELPAERPIFVNDFCHPCSRVVWNVEVLRAEKEHQAQHERQECDCGTIFVCGKERSVGIGGGGGGGGGQRKTSKGKGKGKGKAVDMAHLIEQAPATPLGDDMALVAHGRPVGGESSSYGGEELTTGVQQSGQCPDPLYYSASVDAPPPRYMTSETSGFVGDGYLPGGYIPRQDLGVGQRVIGMPGAGMRWYPAPLPALPIIPMAYEITPSPYSGNYPPKQKAMSIPRDMIFGNFQNTDLEGERIQSVESTPSAEPRAPTIVSSDMATRGMS